MKNEWKKSLSRILIAAMLLSTMPSSGVAAATVLTPDESRGTVTTDSLLEESESNETVPLDSLVVPERNTNEEDELTINVGNDPEYTTTLYYFEYDSYGRGFLEKLKNTLDHPKTCDIQNGDPSVKQVSSNVYYVSWKTESGNEAYKEDVIISFEYDVQQTDSLNIAEIKLSTNADITNDTYSLKIDSENSDLGYDVLKFDFYNVVYWEHGAKECEGQPTEHGEGGFVVEGEYISWTTDPTLVKNGATIVSFPSVVKTGYTFKGWYEITDEGVGAEITSSSQINKPRMVVRAIWEEETAPHVHEWEFDTDPEDVKWYGNDSDGYSSASIIKTCKRSGHTGEKSVDVSVDTSVSEDGIVCEEGATRCYTAVFNSDVDPDIKGEFVFQKTVSIRAKHEWTVSFNWISVSYNATDTKFEATAYCRVGGETVPASDLKLSNKMVGTTIEYDAQAKDPNEKVYHSYKNVDKNGIVRDGHARQVLNGDIVIVGLEDEYPYTGKKITPDFYVMDGDVVLANGGDYSVKYTNNKNVGEAMIEISGKGNYKDKNAVAKFKIYDPFQRAKDEGVTLAAGVKSIAKIRGSFVYNGKAQYPATITVNLNTKPKSTLTLTHEGGGVYTNEGEETVIISVVNNIEKGTATVAAVGADKKVKTKTFSIQAADIGAAKVVEGLEAEYSSKGAIPEGLKVTWKNGDEEEVTLTEDQDFDVKYSNNNAAGTGTIKITGKKNFKGKLEGSFTIKPLEVDEIDAVEAFDKVKAGKLKVTVLDKQGFKVPDKKLSVTVLNEEGTAIDGKTKLTAGTKITVVVKSADSASVVIAEDGISKDAVVGTKMGSVKVDAKKLTKTYSGEAIELTEEDMGSVIVTYKKTPLVYGEDFVIIGYANNVDKGSMTVTIAGTGEDNGRGVFSGTKTFKVKIVAKSFE